MNDRPASANGERAAFDTAGGVAVSSNTKSEVAYRMLKHWVIEGTLAPGHALEQAALAQMVGVSLTPLREAIRRLEGEGLVRVEPHRGVLVVPMTRQDLHDIYESRLALEPFATRLAAQRSSTEERAVMTGYAAFEPGTSGSPERVRHRYETHRAIYAACGNATLVGMLDMVWDRHDRYSVMMQRWTEANPAFLDGIAAGPDDHALLVDAVVNGRAREAEGRVRDEVKRQLMWLARRVEFLADG